MVLSFFVAVVKRIITVFVSVACLISSPVFGYKNPELTPIKEDLTKLTFATLSDIHLKDNFIRQSILELGLKDFDGAKTKLDALLLCGDNTDGGQEKEYERLYASLSKYDTAKNVLISNGNHDTWTEDGTYNLAKTYFLEYASKITGMKIENEYYMKKINGYTFIVMGSQWRRTAAYFSQEQLDWLSEQMEIASRDGKPIFVISHWPINGTHGLPYSFEMDESDPMDGGIGENSDAVNSILQRYKNVFLITGHLHSGLSNKARFKPTNYASIERLGNIYSVNLPSYMYMSLKGHMSNGTGYVFEVYDNEVVIRARNYVAGVWLDKYSNEIELV